MDHNYASPVAPSQSHQPHPQQQDRGIKRSYPTSSTSSSPTTAASGGGGISTFSRAAVSYPRKRAIAACQVCRGRKTKCDNERPSCGFCRQAGAICVYEGDKQATFDAASLAILDRLAKIETRLDSLSIPPVVSGGGQQPPVHNVSVPLQLGFGGIAPSASTTPQQHSQLSQLPPIQYPLSQSFKTSHGIIPQQSLPLTPPIQNPVTSPTSAGNILPSTGASIAATLTPIIPDQNQQSHFPPTNNSLKAPIQSSRRSEKEKRLSRLAAVGSTCQAVLRWPIFEGTYDPDAVLAPIFEDDSDDSDDDLEYDDLDGGRWGDLKGSAMDVDEKELERYDLRHLIERFLTNVQTKNPILDQGILEQYVDEIERRGFDGSGKSCIVLMVCALGAVSAPYSECFPNTPKSSPIYPDLNIGKKFYLAAKKRFGTAIVRNKLTTVQCLFLAGMYCMYTMQQFSAWKMFNSASVACQAYLMKRKTWRGLPSSAGPIANISKGRRKKRRMGADDDEREEAISEETQNFEKRIYWSCVKSENEICVELETCTSGLSEVRYPHAFPSPPRHSRSPPPISSPPVAHVSAASGEGVYPLSSVLNASSSPAGNNNNIQSPLSNSTNTPHTPAISIATNSSRNNYHTGSTTANPQEDEITWFYYLAEIALRKIERKINEALHPEILTGGRRLSQPSSDSEEDDSNDEDLNGGSNVSAHPRRRHRQVMRNKYTLRPPLPSPPRAPTPAEMEELVHLTAEFETQLGIWYSYLPPAVKFEESAATPCRDERLQYLRGRCWKTKSDLYRPFLYHLIHQPHANHIRDTYSPAIYARVAEFARKALMCDMLAVKATVIEHRHHGAWLTLRNSTSGSLVYLAARKCGWFVREEEAGRDGLAVIPDGCEEALETTKMMLRWWGEKMGARDALPLHDLLCKLDEEWFGKVPSGGNGSGAIGGIPPLGMSGNSASGGGASGTGGSIGVGMGMGMGAGVGVGVSRGW